MTTGIRPVHDRAGIFGWARMIYPYDHSVTDARYDLERDLIYFRGYGLMPHAVLGLQTLRTVLRPPARS